METSGVLKARTLCELLGINSDIFSAEDTVSDQTKGGNEMSSVLKSKKKTKDGEQQKKTKEPKEEVEEMSSGSSTDENSEEYDTTDSDLDFSGEEISDEDKLVEFYSNKLRQKGLSAVKKYKEKQSFEPSTSSATKGTDSPKYSPRVPPKKKSPKTNMTTETMHKYMKSLREANDDLIMKMGDGEGNFSVNPARNRSLKDSLLKKYGGEALADLQAVQKSLTAPHSTPSISDSDSDVPLREITKKMTEIGLSSNLKELGKRGIKMGGSGPSGEPSTKPNLKKKGRADDKELKKKLNNLKEMVNKRDSGVTEEHMIHARTRVNEWMKAEAARLKKKEPKSKSTKESGGLPSTKTTSTKTGVVSLSGKVKASSPPSMETAVRQKNFTKKLTDLDSDLKLMSDAAKTKTVRKPHPLSPSGPAKTPVKMGPVAQKTVKSSTSMLKPSLERKPMKDPKKAAKRNTDSTAL